MIENKHHIEQIFRSLKLERMANRFRIENRIDEHSIHFDLYWNESGRLTRIGWNETSVAPEIGPDEQPPYGVAAILRDFKSYFRDGSPLLPMHWDLVDDTALSEFSRSVYQATLEIPHGETRTYAWVAKKAGRPLAARAAGQALRKNPFPILIPCHRVVSDKSLGGFMGTDDPSDLELRFKFWLLDLERTYRSPCFAFLDPYPRLQSRAGALA